MKEGDFIKKIRISLCFIILNILLTTNIYALSAQDNLIYEGIDVSNWQKYIDYTQVKNAGIDVVYIKASEGLTFIDSYFEINYKNAKANGLKVGFYHFLTATTVSQAESQANFFASVIEGKEVDCKLAMDYEDFSNIGKNQINQIAVAFMKKLKQLTKKDVIVYSNLNNLKNTFGSDVANEGKLWIAYYNNSDDLKNVSSSWNTYIGIQYTSRGRVAGINGNVDRDRFSKEIFLEDVYPSESSSGSGDGNNKEIINYIVKKGDTLSAIALKYGTTVSEIARLNGIQNVNLIYPCQILEIIMNSNTSSSQKINYTIKRGDTLWRISKNYGVSIQDIIKWNNIKNPNLIYAGNVLVLYVNGSSTSNIGDYITYTVRRGDTLWGISRRYGTTVNRLATVNGIRNPRLIYPGQVLKIY